MSQRTSPSGDGPEVAGSALAARAQELAQADSALADLVGGAHAIVVAAISRLDQISAEIEAAVSSHAVDSPAQAREFGRLLVDKNREILDVVAAAKCDADAKTVALLGMIDQYR